MVTDAAMKSVPSNGLSTRNIFQKLVWFSKSVLLLWRKSSRFKKKKFIRRTCKRETSVPIQIAVPTRRFLGGEITHLGMIAPQTSDRYVPESSRRKINENNLQSSMPGIG